MTRSGALPLPFGILVAITAGFTFLSMPGSVAANPNYDSIEQVMESTEHIFTKTNQQGYADSKTASDAKRLLEAIDSILQDAAEQRQDSRKLPSRSDYMVAVPPWTETREDRRDKIHTLLNSALEIVTDVPIVKLQEEMARRRKAIGTLKDQISKLREKRLDAPKGSLLPGLLTDTVGSIDSDIKDLEQRITANREEVRKTRTQIHTALQAKGVEMSEEQLDLLLDSVLGGDLVKLVAAFDAARVIDERLGVLMNENNENLNAARRYFGMHAALFAMLIHAQDTLIKKIDEVYLARLKTIRRDIYAARSETRRLLKQQNRLDQKRALLANSKAQDFAERVSEFYRDYLLTQLRQILAAQKRTLKDLRIADNTFETVEASFQLRALIEDARASFKAIQRLEAPGFDQIFQNKQLRQEFENLTRKLDVPTS